MKGVFNYLYSNGGEVDADKFLDALEQATDDSNNQAGWKKKKTFAPSTLTWNHGVCPRYWYIAFEGAEFEEQSDAGGKDTRESGIAAHERLGPRIKTAFPGSELEIEIEHADPPIFGYADGEILWSESLTVLLEIKNISNKSFYYRQKHGKPAPYHMLQLLIYMYIKKLDYGIVLYENRDNLKKMAFVVTMTDNKRIKVEELFAWMREVRAAWEQQLLPERPFKTPEHRICQACPVSKACWEQYGEGEISIAKRKEIKL